MKKIYLTLFAITATVSSLLAQTVPTCSLNPTFISSNKMGIWPDSATNFISGTVGVSYVQNITVKVPKDTITSGVRFCFNRFELSNPTAGTNYGLPPGLNFGSSTAALANGTINASPSLIFPGNANNCGSIYGTPTTAGTYTLHLKIQPFTNAIVNQQTIKTTLGENKVTFNASNLSSGTYIYSLKYKNAITTKRMMVIN